MNLPESFIHNLKTDFPNECEDIISSLNTKPPVSIRLNTEKSNGTYDIKSEIPWANNAYYLNARPAFYADPYYHSGAYYVQEASSMVIDYILNHLNLAKDNLLALDLCAAPGGKSTILSSFLKDRGVLLSNEIVWKRNLILQENLERWGLPNTIITHNNSSDFKGIKNLFDIVMIDAPCSGEGMFRKDHNVIQEWSDENVQICCERQELILEDIESSIKPGGYLIYSTCTYNKKENEEQIANFLNYNEYEIIEFPDLEKSGIYKSIHENVVFYRFFPHKIEGEGLSFCVLRKKGSPGKIKPNKNKALQKFEVIEDLNLKNWINQNAKTHLIQREKEVFAIEFNEIATLLELNKNLRIIKFGVHIGDLINKDFIPSHALAMSTICNEKIEKIDVDLSQALKALQKDLNGIEIPSNGSKWVRLCFDENNLAFAKVLPNRLNIHLPKTFRIRKNIDEFLTD